MRTNHFPTNLSPPVTLKMGQGHQNLISTFTCPSIVDVQVWLKSIHSFKRQSADKPFSNNLSPPVTFKWGQGHQNLISSFACPSNKDMQV